MWRSTPLLEYPEDEPELVFASLPAGPRTRRGVGIRKAGLRIITVAEASFDTSTTLTSRRKSNLNRLSLPLSAVVGAPLSVHSQSPPTRPRRARTPIMHMPHRKPPRYEAAHRALLDRSGNIPPETSPEDLKIQTLERATTFLRAQIQEAQEYAEQLRQYLADRNTQPGEYQGYQREKWRMDRRLAALRVLTEAVRVTHPEIPQNRQYETNSLPARKRANLSSFFQRGSHKAPLRFKCAVTGKALEKRVLKQVSPLLLEPSIPSTRIQSLSIPNNLLPLYVLRKQSDMTNTPRPLSNDSMGTAHGGIALILPPTLRPEEEIIAEMGDITLPAYALNLLEDLDYIHDKIPLQPEPLALDRSPFSEAPSPLLVTASDWDYPRPNPSVASPRRTATVRIPDRHLADALLTSPETENTPRRRRRTHKVSLDPALFKDDSRSDKLGEVAPIRHSVHASGEEKRKPKGLLRKKSSGVFSLVSKNSDRREGTTSTPRKNIASMVKRRISAINRFH